METLENLLRDARAVREQNFGPVMGFYAPSVKRYETSEFPGCTAEDFVAVSVTGSTCQLGCEHCRGMLLGSMREVGDPRALLDLARGLAARGGRGLLVSGGADLEGRVPLLPYVDAMAEIRESLGLRVVVHTGIVDVDLARGLARAGIECAMLDVIGDDRTLDEVYHLGGGTRMIEDSLRLLSGSGVRTVPHVVVGIDHGRIGSEIDALELIARASPSAVVLVVLNPLPGTPMHRAEPPPVDGVAGIMARARIMFPRIPVLLGCARPGGPYRAGTDLFALRAGLNGIAFPAEGTVAAAREMGYEPRFARECCSLAIDPDACFLRDSP